MKVTDFRQERGRTIATIEGQVRRIDEHSYKVHSQSECYRCGKVIDPFNN